MIKKKKMSTAKWGYIFLIPWAVIFLVFTVYPFFYGLVISFTDFDFVNMSFVGFQNYKDIILDDLFLKAAFNTIKYALLLIPSTIIASLWVAKTIENRSKFLQSFAKAAFYITSIISEVALVIVWKWMFSPAFGAAVAICDFFGIDTIDWFGNPAISLPLLSGLILTFTVAQPIILYSAAMGNIPDAYYESASLDGATSNQIFFKITLPLLKSTTVFILITQTISILQIFTTPYLMTGGGPDNGTSTILLLLYKSAFLLGKYGYAAAIGIILFVCIGIVAAIQFKLTKSDTIQY